MFGDSVGKAEKQTSVSDLAGQDGRELCDGDGFLPGSMLGRVWVLWLARDKGQDEVVDLLAAGIHDVLRVLVGLYCGGLCDPSGSPCLSGHARGIPLLGSQDVDKVWVSKQLVVDPLARQCERQRVAECQSHLYQILHHLDRHLLHRRCC